MTANATREPTPQRKEPTTHAGDRDVFWPILIARQAHARVDGHPGMTLTIWVSSGLGLTLSGVLFTGYIWPLWQRCWLTVWPSALPGYVMALPLVGLLLGTLFNKLWHGRIWAGLILTAYLVLHANLYVPPPTAQESTEAGEQTTAIQSDGQPASTQPSSGDTPVTILPEPGLTGQSAAVVPTTLQLRRIGPIIRANPEILIKGLTTALAPVAAIWLFGVLFLSFLWPSFQAGITMVNTTQQARDAQRYFNRQRQLQVELLDRQFEHEQIMAQRKYDEWSAEEQHAALQNHIAQQHQLAELREYQRTLGLTQDVTVEAVAPTSVEAVAPINNDDFLAKLVGQE